MKSVESLAAIDLGSNSFHMVVARIVEGELRIQEALSEKVQLGAGLDADNRISEESRVRALDCLARFSQRLAGVPDEGVRVVGTNALRMARNARAFLAEAEAVLGHDIEIVAGREEARLIYLGVSHSSPANDSRRLVIDIGGGSTELIIGENFEAVETESLHMGCVSYSGRYFADGKITEKQLHAAITAARQEVLTIERNYRRMGWDTVLGASGTIKAIAQVCQANGWSEGQVTAEGLAKIRKRMLRAGSIGELAFKGLRDDRRGIFPAGVAVLSAIFEQLDISEVTLSSGALREGLLYDLLGRLGEEDVRERSIETLMKRHHVDQSQAARVCDSAMQFHAAVAPGWLLDDEQSADFLRWAALLHEVGLAVSHSQFHKHGAYLVENSDLPGFSRQEQQQLALLVRAHRRKLPVALFAELPEQLGRDLTRLALLLRLAVRIHHSRSDDPVPAMDLQVSEETLSLFFPGGWLDEHPLTLADLQQEQDCFAMAGYELVIGHSGK